MPGRHIQNPGSSIQEEVKERGVRKFLGLKKNSVPDMGGKCCEKKQSPHFSWTLFFPEPEKNKIHKKLGLCFFFTAFLPMSGTLFFFRTEIFGLFSPSLPLVRWSQSFGYGFLASYDIKICTRPNIFLSKVPKKSS